MLLDALPQDCRKGAERRKQFAPTASAHPLHRGGIRAIQTPGNNMLSENLLNIIRIDAQRAMSKAFTEALGKAGIQKQEYMENPSMRKSI